MTDTQPLPARSLRRLWQPRRGLFWLVLAFNALSSVLAWYLHLSEPALLLRWVLSLLALPSNDEIIHPRKIPRRSLMFWRMAQSIIAHSCIAIRIKRQKGKK